MKQKLIEALKAERERFKGRGQSTEDHDMAITYLETGSLPSHPEDFELLEAAINDFDTLCSDYDVTK